MTRSARLLLVALATASLTGAVPTPDNPWTPGAAWAQQGKKVDLRPKFIKGQEIRLKIELVNRAKVVSSTPNRGMNPPAEDATSKDQDSSQEYVLLLKVKETNPETGSTLELVYEKIKLRMKSPDGDIEFDSSKSKKGDPVDDLLRPMVGTALTIEMDAKGNVKSVKGNDTTQDLGGDLPGPLGAGGGLKDLFGNVMNFGPPSSGQASVGESWSTDSKMEAPGGTWTLQTTNTLRGVNAGKADIDIKGKLTLDPASSGAGPHVKVKDARYSGRAVWNTERGMLESMESRLRVESQDTKNNQTSTNEATMNVTRLK